MGELAETAKALASPVEKLIEAVRAAIGKIYEPRYLKKIADAKAYEITTISEAMRSSIDIPINYQAGEISADTSQFDDFVKRTENRLAYQELKKQANIESVIASTYEELLSTDAQQVEETPVDVDWMTRFVNSIEDVSDTNMQVLWSKILAGEIKQPESYSLRTLETLKNLSMKEAQLFEKMCNNLVFIDDCGFIPCDTGFLKDHNIRYDDVLKLGECGLMNSSGMVILTKSIVAKSTIIMKNNETIVFAKPKDGKTQKLKVSHFSLTASGYEIFKLFNSNPPQEYFLDCARWIANNNQSIEFTAHRIISEDDDIYEYEDDNLMTSEVK